jgi:uncharacterized RmlC-like cupin family protein
VTGLPYRVYLYIVLTASAFIAIIGATSLASFAVDEAWPGRPFFGRSTSELAAGLAAVIVAAPIWLLHWRFASRLVARDSREDRHFLRQAYFLIVPVVSIVSVGVAARAAISDLLGGDTVRGENLAAFAVWGGAWVFHWRSLRRSWRPGDTGRPLHRWYLYGVSAGSLVLLAFGVSSVLAELLRAAYESAFRAGTISISGPWTHEMRGGLANAIVGGVGWGWHWWQAARGDGGSILREVYATGGAVFAAASAVSTLVLVIAVLIRPAFGHSADSLIASWHSLPRLAADLLVAGAVWLHLSPGSPWSRRGVEPRTALGGALTAEIRAWEIFGVGALGAGAVIAIALVMSLPAATTRGLLVDTGSRFDAVSAILATGVLGTLVTVLAMRRGMLHEAESVPVAAAVTRFFHFGLAAAGLLAAVGGTAAALYVFIEQTLDGNLGTATLLDARWGVAIGLVGGVITAWRWRAIRGLQLRGTGLQATGARLPAAMAARPRVRVVHAADREVEVSSGAMTRLAGVSRATVGAEGIHLAISAIPPGQRSSAHYHTNCESAIYVASGHGTFLAGDDLTERMAIGPGDFIHVPADAPHQPVNESDTEPLVLIVARNTPVELVVELPEAPPKLQ